MGAQYIPTPAGLVVPIEAVCKLVGVVGFEPTTLTSQRSGSSR